MQTNDAPEEETPDTPNVISDVVSAHVTAWLETNERSQAWLARRMDVGTVWLNRRLTGRTSWSVNDLMHVAAALDVDVDKLVVAIPEPAAPFGRTLLPRQR